MFSLIIHNTVKAMQSHHEAKRRAAQKTRDMERAYIASLTPDQRAAYAAEQQAWLEQRAEEQKAAFKQQLEDHRKAMAIEAEAMQRMAARRALEAEADATYRNPKSDHYDPWLVMEERLGLRKTSSLVDAMARWWADVPTEPLPPSD